MPVEITLPLSPKLQKIADAREAVQELAEKVENLKEKLKAAKSAWEGAVEEWNKEIDEMIASERTPSLFNKDDKPAAASDSPPTEPTPPAPAGEGVVEV